MKCSLSRCVCGSNNECVGKCVLFTSMLRNYFIWYDFDVRLIKVDRGNRSKDVHDVHELHFLQI